MHKVLVNLPDTFLKNLMSQRFVKNNGLLTVESFQNRSCKRKP